jgi:hypothetical protein
LERPISSLRERRTGDSYQSRGQAETRPEVLLRRCSAVRVTEGLEASRKLVDMYDASGSGRGDPEQERKRVPEGEPSPLQLGRFHAQIMITANGRTWAASQARKRAAEAHDRAAMEH